MKLLTSAKINLNLKVFPEKKDNFHKLSTVMIPICLLYTSDAADE